MQIVDMLIDPASTNEFLLLMDGYAGYKQNCTAKEDVPEKALSIPEAINTFEWMVISSGLKIIEANCQRAINFNIHIMNGKFTEVYINDVIVKFNKVNHLNYSKHAYLRMRKYSLKMNDLECAFGERAVNFLGFRAYQRGIVDKMKAKALLKLSVLNAKKQYGIWKNKLFMLFHCQIVW